MHKNKLFLACLSQDKKEIRKYLYCHKNCDYLYQKDIAVFKLERDKTTEIW
jgi:hypothetical protein